MKDWQFVLGAWVVLTALSPLIVLFGMWVMPYLGEAVCWLHGLRLEGHLCVKP